MDCEAGLRAENHAFMNTIPSISSASNAPTAEDVDMKIRWLHEEATRRSGLSDFGPDDYLTPMRMLVEEMDKIAMSEAGRTFWCEELIGTLIPRAAREKNWQEHPKWQEQEIRKPLVICGVPRTGTTALHKVMSIDPQFQGLENWLSIWPMPRPPREQWSQHTGYRLAAEILQARGAQIPGLTSQHEVIVDEVDECMEVMKLGFINNRFPELALIPDYDAFFQSQDELAQYRELADTLKLIGLNDHRPWLLKNPGHFVGIETLLQVFPDARVIVTHRDPLRALASLNSILSHPRKLISPDLDLHLPGKRDIDYWSKGVDAMRKARAERPTEQFHDVDHAEFHRDPISTIRKIYDYFGLSLDMRTERRMRIWISENPVGKHGEHAYDPADYGLNAAEVSAAFKGWS